MRILNSVHTRQLVSSRSYLCSSIRSIFNAKNLGAGSESTESADDFERRIFGGVLDGDSKNASFFDKLDRLGQNRGGSDSPVNVRFGERVDTLSDGVDLNLKKAATAFGMTDEVKEDDYSFRPDVKFRPGMTYTLRDLDLTKPAAQKPFRRPEFETTTKEVLRKADFRNVRFLANFLTEAGLIIKRNKTKISAKAQRKVAREIKTARALGLLPFTTMGTKQFQFGKSMEDFDQDVDFDNLYGRPVNDFFVGRNA
ncbi:ribosomal protein S18 [Wolffia australiana]